MLKKSELLLALKDRPMVVLLLAIALGSLVIIVMSLVRLQVSDVQVPIRYSDYGQTNLYRDKWYMLFVFTGFGVMTLVLNSLIGIKIFSHSSFLARGFLAVSLFMVVLGIIVTSAIFRLVALSI